MDRMTVGRRKIIKILDVRLGHDENVTVVVRPPPRRDQRDRSRCPTDDVSLAADGRLATGDQDTEGTPITDRLVVEHDAGYSPGMRVSRSRRLLFVHVQKTGGNSMNTILESLVDDITTVRPKHRSLVKTLAVHPEFSDYYTFGFVRNPWDRLVSWWSMFHGVHDREDRPKQLLHLERKPIWRAAEDYPDFETFIFSGTRQFKRLRTPQIKYLSYADGRMASFIGRTETFEKDAHRILEHFDLPRIDIPQMNESRHTHYRDYYSPRSRRRVARLFEPDIRTFDYVF